MFERYTERARRTIFFARYEASQFGSLTIEVEHLLLGLLREDRQLTHLIDNSLSVEEIRADIQALLNIREKVPTSVDLPLSSDCKRILAYAAEEAEKLAHRHIGTEHLLLGILREEQSGAARVMVQRGFNLEAIRETVARKYSRTQEGFVETHELRHEFAVQHNPALPKSGVVPDAETAKGIAEAVWKPLYGSEAVAQQWPLQIDLKHNVWTVTGQSDEPLFVFILQTDGRVLSVGRGRSGSQS